MGDSKAFEAEKYKERLKIALKAAKICVFEVDVVRQLYTFFDNAEDIFGVSGEEILRDVRRYSKLEAREYQRAVSEYFSHPDDFPVIDKAFQAVFRGETTTYEARMRAGGSEFIWCKLDITPLMENGKTVKMIGVITDISKMKTKREDLEKAVRHDDFTGLYNKKCSMELIQKILAESSGEEHALILVDIDNFKYFNDTYGHAEGDKVIKSVAELLKNSFRKTDITGRFGGDEFLLLVRDIPDAVWLRKKLEKLVTCEHESYSCTNSIGIAIFPQDAVDFELLFKKADEALYHSKLVRGKYTFFSEMEV